MIAQAPPAIVQIAERVQTQERGAVVYRLHRTFDVHAGPMHRHDDRVLAIACDGGQTVKVRVISEVVGGKSADAAAIAQLQTQYEHPKPEDVFHRPFDPKYVAEYSYRQVDAQTYAFTSSMRDGSHGDGTFHLDANGNVVSYQYTPLALPRYAKTGTVIDERSQVLPGFWAVTRETQQYSGHYAIFGGGADVSIAYESFTRYPDLASAVAALDAVTQ